METKPKTWLDNTNVGYHYPALTPKELVDVWKANRNSITAALAADELLRRVDRGDVAIREVHR